jgi:hypothetical protein
MRRPSASRTYKQPSSPSILPYGSSSRDLEEEDEKEKRRVVSVCKMLPILNFVAILILGFCVVILLAAWKRDLETRHVALTSDTTPVVVEQKRENAPLELLFTLYPPENDSKKGMFVSIPSEQRRPLNQMKRYEVCCVTRDADNFVCRSVSKTLGVDCVIQKHRAVVSVQHAIMVGARCALRIWYKEN